MDRFLDIGSNELKEVTEQAACPPICGALPDWPRRERNRPFFLGIHQDYPMFGDPYPSDQPGASCQQRIYCVPEPAYHRLEAFLKAPGGGSVLITGYRGVGKTNLVGYALAQLIEAQKTLTEDDRNKAIEVLPVRINLSTSRTIEAILHVMVKSLKDLLARGEHELDKGVTDRLDEVYKRCVYTCSLGIRENIRMNAGGKGKWNVGFFSASASASGGKDSEESTTLQENPYTVYEAQWDIQAILKELRDLRFRVIFIMDELDKLAPRNTSTNDQSRLDEILDLITDLKPMVTDARAHYIFIAGKDVDDSWQEDQSKGEGLFESVFQQNIYVPSLLSSQLRPSLGPHQWVLEMFKDVQGEANQQRWIGHFFDALLEEIGIPKRSWAYNTGLLILPRLSENTLKRILKRRDQAHRPDSENLWFTNLKVALVDLSRLSERDVRRLRYVLRYLTYKGRGIPRKILREFHGNIDNRCVTQNFNQSFWKQRGDSHYIFHAPKLVKQKIKFFATICFALEERKAVFGEMNDKGRVATFHIVDYILKFYKTGFSWADVEHAAFFNDRDDLFPSRELVDTILNLLDGTLVELVDPRTKRYILSPHARNDLQGLYMAFGPEQTELRFTNVDLSNEIKRLQSYIQSNEQEPVYASLRAYLRLGQIYEELEKPHEARMIYGNCLRRVRDYLDIQFPGLKDNQKLGGIFKPGLCHYASVMMKILQRIGHIYQTVQEYHLAIQAYQEAVHILDIVLHLYSKQSEVKQEDENNDVFNLGCVTRGFHLVKTNRNKLNPRAVELRKKLEAVFLGHDAIEQGFEDFMKHFTSLVGHGGLAALTEIDPSLFPRVINSMAVTLDKMGHRLTANKILGLSLKYYDNTNDLLGVIEQLIFIGEVMVRRRDIHLAAIAYQVALAESGRLPDSQEIASQPVDFSSELYGKIYEKLGDLYMASGGAVFDTSDQDHLDSLDLVSPRLHLRAVETRPEEFHYSQAVVHYFSCRQYFKIFDIYLKKMLVRSTVLLNTLADSLTQPLPEHMAVITRSWGSFWIAADKALNVLAEIRPGGITQPLGIGVIRDRHRLGALCRRMGNFLMSVSRFQEHCPFLNPFKQRDCDFRSQSEEATNFASQEYLTHQPFFEKVGLDNQYNRYHDLIRDHTNLKKSAVFLNKVFGFILDNRKLYQSRTIGEPEDYQITGLRSPLNRISIRDWQRKIVEPFSDSNNSEDIREYFMVDTFRKMVVEIREEVAEHEEVKQALGLIIDKLSVLALAETSLLCSQICLDDNILDMDAADVNRDLGRLYLQCIKLLLELNTNLNLCLFDKCRFKRAWFYLNFHLASKRFLVNAIHIYQNERGHERARRAFLGFGHQTLADLQFIRSEVLASLHEPHYFDRPLPGLYPGWRKPLVEIMEIMSKNDQIHDQDVDIVRPKVVQAYRDACREYLAEMRDYTERYRLLPGVYASYGPITDRARHFNICKAIYTRCWDGGPNQDQKLHEATRQVFSNMQNLVQILSGTIPVLDRNGFLEKISTLMGEIHKYTPIPWALGLKLEDASDEKPPHMTWIKDPKDFNNHKKHRMFFHPSGNCPDCASSDEDQEDGKSSK